MTEASRAFLDVQLNLTEKGLRKMMEMAKSYRHALLNADVLDTFKVPSQSAMPSSCAYESVHDITALRRHDAGFRASAATQCAQL